MAKSNPDIRHSCLVPSATSSVSLEIICAYVHVWMHVVYMRARTYFGPCRVTIELGDKLIDEARLIDCTCIGPGHAAVILPLPRAQGAAVIALVAAQVEESKQLRLAAACTRMTGFYEVSPPGLGGPGIPTSTPRSTSKSRAKPTHHPSVHVPPQALQICTVSGDGTDGTEHTSTRENTQARAHNSTQ